MVADILHGQLHILRRCLPTAPDGALRRLGNPTQKYIQLSQQQQFVARSGSIKAQHGLHTVLQLLGLGALEGTPLLSQAAAFEIVRRPASGKAYPNMVPGLLGICLIGAEFTGQNQKSISRTDLILYSLSPVYSPSRQAIVHHIVLPHCGANRLSRLTILAAAKQERQLSNFICSVREPGSTHPTPLLFEP